MSDKEWNTEQGDAFTLEDILAEYKSEAYIAGERKLPVKEMQKRADDIVREAKAKEELPAAKEAPPASKELKYAGEVVDLDDFDEIDEIAIETEDKAKKSKVTIIPFEEFEQYKSQHSPEVKSDFTEFQDGEKSQEPLEEAGEHLEKPSKARKGFFAGLFGKKKPQNSEAAAETESKPEQEESEHEAELDDFDEEVIPDDEPDLKEVYRVYGQKARSLGVRSLVAAGVSGLLILLTVFSDPNIPFSVILRENLTITISVMLVLEAVAIAAGYDVILSGIKDILTLKTGAESLVAVSCLASVMDAGAMLLTKDYELGAPFCAVSSCSMFFALLGAFYLSRAYMLSFRSAASVTQLYCVTAEHDRLEGGSVLVKNQDNAHGFFTKSNEANLPEKALSFAAPVLILSSVVLSLIASLGKGNASLFFRCFAAISAAAAPFSTLLAFGHPFKTLALRLSAVGAAIAGWQGARDIGDAVGTVICDEDLFPSGTLVISGVNIISDFTRDRVLSCTGSVIITSGSGLSQAFSELLEKQHCRTYHLESFSVYEGGGLSGSVGSDRILVGSSGFMNLMGIRIQENMNIKNALFCAINGSLAGVFIIDYIPTRSVRNALLALLSHSMMTLFALRDFNITTMMLRQKFKIPTGNAENIDVLTFADRYRLSDPPLRKKLPAALIFREGLGPYASVVLGGRSLQTCVRIGTAIMIFGAILGAALMFYICSKGAFSAASALNTLIFMFAWLLPTFLLSRLVGRY